MKDNPRLSAFVGDASRKVFRSVKEYSELNLVGVDHVLVGLSGGGDSLALVRAAISVFDKVSVGIVNHRVQAAATNMTNQAKTLAESLGVEVHVLEVDVDVNHPDGLEAAARTKRFEALFNLRASIGASVILLGHTMDDQAESLFTGLFRGSGPRSIVGMNEESFSGLIHRPMLFGVRRVDTYKACEEWGLIPVVDGQNFDHKFLRVKVREKIIPKIEEVVPHFVEAWSLSSFLVGKDNDFLDRMAQEKFDDWIVDGRLKVNGFDQIDVVIRTRIIRLWLQSLKIFVSFGQIRDIDSMIVNYQGQRGVMVPNPIDGSISSRTMVSRIIEEGERFLILSEAN